MDPLYFPIGMVFLFYMLGLSSVSLWIHLSSASFSASIDALKLVFPILQLAVLRSLLILKPP